MISSEFEHLNVIYGVPFLSAHILTYNVAGISALCNVLLYVARLPRLGSCPVPVKWLIPVLWQHHILSWFNTWYFGHIYVIKNNNRMETYQKNSGGNWCCQISISPGTRTPLLFLIETHSLTRSLLLQVFSCQTQVIIVQGSLYYSLENVATSPSSGYCELQILPC